MKKYQFTANPFKGDINQRYEGAFSNDQVYFEDNVKEWVDKYPDDWREIDFYNQEAENLTPRQHMAGLAMQGLLAGFNSNETITCIKEGLSRLDSIKKVSYMIADKMLEK